MGEVVTTGEMMRLRESFRQQGKRVVFTNGTFDLLHRGHVEYLNKANELGDVLIVGLNSDNSVRAIKGEGKPIVREDDRAIILANLKSVDYVVIFEEEIPINLINSLIPEVLVKGGDWEEDEIVGGEIVKENGGKVVTVKLTPGRSTTAIIKKIISNYK